MKQTKKYCVAKVVYIDDQKESIMWNIYRLIDENGKTLENVDIPINDKETYDYDFKKGQKFVFSYLKFGNNYKLDRPNKKLKNKALGYNIIVNNKQRTIEPRLNHQDVIEPRLNHQDVIEPRLNHQDVIEPIERLGQGRRSWDFQPLTTSENLIYNSIYNNYIYKYILYNNKLYRVKKEYVPEGNNISYANINNIYKYMQLIQDLDFEQDVLLNNYDNVQVVQNINYQYSISPANAVDIVATQQPYYYISDKDQLSGGIQNTQVVQIDNKQTYKPIMKDKEYKEISIIDYLNFISDIDQIDWKFIDINSLTKKQQQQAWQRIRFLEAKKKLSISIKQVHNKQQQMLQKNKQKSNYTKYKNISDTKVPAKQIFTKKEEEKVEKEEKYFAENDLTSVIKPINDKSIQLSNQDNDKIDSLITSSTPIDNDNKVKKKKNNKQVGNKKKLVRTTTTNNIKELRV